MGPSSCVRPMAQQARGRPPPAYGRPWVFQFKAPQGAQKPSLPPGFEFRSSDDTAAPDPKKATDEKRRRRIRLAQLSNFAQSPFRNLLMQGFMLRMSGTSIN